MVGKKLALLSIVCFFLGTLICQASSVRAAEAKIGVINFKKVVLTSAAGAKATTKINEKIKGFQEKFKADEQSLVNLRDDIQKKSSVWSKDKKEQAVIEYNKKQRDLQAKQEDARAEITQMRENELQPVFNAIKTIFEKYGKEHGYSLILDSSNGLMYFADSIDLTNDFIKTLDKSMAKK